MIGAWFKNEYQDDR